MPRSFRRRLRGMAAAEFLLVAVPLLLAGLGTVEASRWYLVRQAVTLALLEGARAGATQHADPAAIAAAVRRGLLPLHGGEASVAGQASARARQQQAEAAMSAHGVPAWHIVIESPLAVHFQDFGEPASRGGRQIGNDYQRERHERDVARGWPQGRGPASGATIFEANTLAVRITYLHRPLVPGLSAMLRGLGRVWPVESPASAGMRRAGALPVTARVMLPMQSAPMAFLTEGDILPPAPPPGAPPVWPGGSAPSGAQAPCTGLWCTPAADAAPAPPPRESWSGGDGLAPHRPDADVPEELCGVVLCCEGL